MNDLRLAEILPYRPKSPHRVTKKGDKMAVRNGLCLFRLVGIMTCNPQKRIMSNPAESLVGQKVNDRWLVIEKIDLKQEESTGGFFSVPYRVKDVKTGERAFLKVIDLLTAMTRYTSSGVSIADALNRVTSSHLFEVALAEACGEKKLDRIVRALDHGQVTLNTVLGVTPFPYIVFELADCDAHKLMKLSRQNDMAWRFRLLHQVAVGIQQLHGIGIAHQDLKRSNVVFFGDDVSKLADLGRAVRKNASSLNDFREIPCQLQNAPLELLYGYQHPEWEFRHLATDLYLLGNFEFVLFYNVPITLAIMEFLPSAFLPEPFNRARGSLPYAGTFQDALPALQNSFSKVLGEIGPHLPDGLRSIYITTLEQLCNPDPEKRGHPKDRALAHGQRFSLQRYIPAFHRMSKIAEQLAT